MRKAIVIAGGDEFRLWPLTQSRPRSLLPVVNRPMMAHRLEWLSRSGFTDVLITLSRHANELRATFGDGHAYGVHLSYQVEDEPHGAAGSVKLAGTWIGGKSCLVVPSDVLTDVDLAPLQRRHEETGAWLTVGLQRGPGPAPYGSVLLDDRGAVTQLDANTHCHSACRRLVSLGIYCVEPDALERVPLEQAYDLGLDLVPQLLAERLPVYGSELEGYWRPVGNFADYRRVQREALEGRVDVRIHAQRLPSGVWVGDGVEIAPTAVVEGPVLIGSSSHIGPEALILPGTILGERCVVGAGACVWGAVLGTGCRVGPDAVLRNCVVDEGAQIAVGASVPEGAVVGSDCRLGGGVRLHAGQRVEPGQVLHADHHGCHNDKPPTHSPWSRPSEPAGTTPSCGGAAQTCGSPVGSEVTAVEAAGPEVLAAGGRR